MILDIFPKEEGEQIMLKKIAYFWILAILIITGCDSKKNSDNHLTILSEEYAPLNFTQEGNFTGEVTEVVKKLLKTTHTDATLDVVPWEEGYQRVLTEPNTALFTTVMTPERKAHLQWVGPVTALDTSFYALSGSGIVIKTLEDVKKMASIATVKDHYTEQMLKEEGFANLISCTNDQEALQKLLSGEVQLYISSNIAMPALLHSAGIETNDIENLFTVSTDLAYIAFSPNTSSKLVAQWQMALDEMKRDGSFKSIYAKWLPKEMPPGIFQLMTEEYPPVTFMKEGKVEGFVTEMVREIASQLNLPDNIRLTSWKNAYNMALLYPNVILFSAERTEEREALFRWVGPVGKNNVIFYAKKGSGIVIHSLEDAKQMEAIATTTDWFTEQYLKKQGFTNLVSSGSPEENVRQLMSGEANLSIFTDLTVSEIVQNAGYSMEDLEPLFTVTQTYFYIAISKDTSEEVYQKWVAALNRLKQDGTFEEIYHNYLPNAELNDLIEP
jgi:polar amino acid transport system substrate-binding protein